MTRLWAAVASAADADATTRAGVAAAIERWLIDGGAGIALFTCHRAEVYGLGPEPGLAATRTLRGDDAVRRLIRVACGLESVIVGEDEVLHQVRESLRAAVRRGVDLRLQRVFETAIAAGRAARANRTESSGNLADRAIEWLCGNAELGARPVLVVGAGRMGSALAHAATVRGAKVMVASRDADRAHGLARLYGGEGVDLEAGAGLVSRSAGVAVALAGPWHQLAHIEAHSLPRIADISAPPAVPAAVRRTLDGTFLGIDDLFAGRTPPLPGGYVGHAEHVVERKTAELVAWLERVA